MGKHEGSPTGMGPLSALALVILSFILSQFALAVLLQLWASVVGKNVQSVLDDASIGVQLLLSVLVYVFIAGILFWFMRCSGKNFKDLGFKKPQAKIIAYVLSGFAIYFVGLLVVQSVVMRIFPSYNIDQAQETGYENVQGIAQIVLAFAGLVIIPPIVEEFIFRGFLYQSLTSKWPKKWAAVITSALFALAHGQWNVAVDTFILSLVLIYLLEKTQNIWASIGLHALKNSIAFLFLLHTAGVF